MQVLWDLSCLPNMMGLFVLFGCFFCFLLWFCFLTAYSLSLSYFKDKMDGWVALKGLLVIPSPDSSWGRACGGWGQIGSRLEAGAPRMAWLAWSSSRGLLCLVRVEALAATGDPEGTGRAHRCKSAHPTSPRALFHVLVWRTSPPGCLLEKPCCGVEISMGQISKRLY